MGNTWSAKIKRSITSVLPVDPKHSVGCENCGACCKLPNRCPFLGEKDGKYYCKVYKMRPLACRKYPRVKSEWLTDDVCGYKFEED
ncbi:MAG: YkgJ family cysteine cluster protein [Candidatus Nanoarchaeia archaeon]